MDHSTLDQSTAASIGSTSDDLYDPTMPGLEDTDDELDDEGIFSNSNEGADFTNLDDDLEVPQPPVLRISKDHPTV